MSSIQHIAELFIYDERDFITAAYRTLLEREPDPIGMNYYLGRLRMGYGKTAIIVQLATSIEAHSHHQINGLTSLIKEEQHANHWFWGLFTHQQRTERLMRQHVDELKRLSNRIAQLPINAAQLSIMHSTSDEDSPNLPTIHPSEPEGFNQLTARTKKIYFQLKKAVARQKNGSQK